jgi:polysaccharide pyruvyl transferase WcaK-like protein
MNVLLIGDSSSNANWGDRAAPFALKKMISESGGNIIATIPESDLKYSTFHNVSNIQDEYAPHNKVKEILKLFIPPLFLKMRENILTHLNPSMNKDVVPTRWQDFERHSRQVFTNTHIYSDLLNAIEMTDAIVINGGQITDNLRIPRAILFLAYIAKTYYDHPVIMVNQTSDLHHPDLYKIAEHVYPLFDDVVYRDVISVERCKHLCNGRFAPDSAFLFKPVSLHEWLPVSRRPTYFDVWPDTAQFDPAAPYICIGGSSLYMYNPQYNAVRGFSELINHIMSIYSGQIILTVSGGPDAGWFEPIAADLKLPLIPLRTPVQQAVDILGNAQAYIGGRWHPSIFALRGGTPVIPLSSKTFKMQALAQMAGLSAHAFDALNLANEKDAIGRQLLSCLEQGAELRLRLREWAEKESEKCWDNVTYLKNFSERIPRKTDRAAPSRAYKSTVIAA